jgi:predicted lysophospholipase L1 biosynthesis ABC-type transport system permease subunit
VNQTLATRFFGNENPVGQNLYMPEPGGRKAYQIIGVVRDVKDNLRATRLAWYLAANQHRVHPFSTQFFLRIERPWSAVVPAIRKALAEEDPKLEIAGIKSADQLLDTTLETDRLLAVLGWTFGALALLLASVGIYGLLSYDVARRRSEIGIRTALGAQRVDVAKVVLYQAASVLVFGLLMGGAAANLLTRFVRALVFEIRANDPRVEVLAGLILIASALAASWLPVLRATRVDPIRALRAE